MSEIWGWFIHAAFLFVVQMPVYVCSHSSWRIIECKLEVISPEHPDSRYFLYDFSLLRGLAKVVF